MITAYSITTKSANFLFSITINHKTALPYHCFTAGLSTEGTKKDLLARLRIYNAHGVVEAIIYKKAVQIPENSESSNGQYCGQEIARELQCAIPEVAGQPSWVAQVGSDR